MGFDQARTDTASRLIAARPGAAYRAFIDAKALIAWLPPQGCLHPALEHPAE